MRILDSERPRVLITGAAGFIGFHTLQKFLNNKVNLVSLDSFFPAYDVKLPQSRAKVIKNLFDHEILNIDLTSIEPHILLSELGSFDVIFHFAAWPGVRQSQINPWAYSKNNLHSFSNILEFSRIANSKQVFYASSSSVYGNYGLQGPVNEDIADGKNLRSYYANTKWLNEMQARNYEERFGVKTTALRFFTVYGEFGRPDMAYWKFVESISSSKVIELYGKDGGIRNFTYIADLTNILFQLLENVEKVKHNSLNIAAGKPFTTMEFLRNIENSIQNKKAILRVVERPSYDVDKTWADQSRLSQLGINLEITKPEIGILNFVKWFLEYENS